MPCMPYRSWRWPPHSCCSWPRAPWTRMCASRRWRSNRLRGHERVAESAQVVIGIAEGHVDHGEPLEVMAHDVFIDHTHAAMQLHGLLAHQSAGLADVS